MKFAKLVIIIAAALSLASCDTKRLVIDHLEDYEAKCFLLNDIMPYYYYWTNEVSSGYSRLNPDSEDIYDFFDDLLYLPKDRWSWMESADDYLETASGEYKGIWGAEFTQPVEDYSDYGIYVQAVWPSSPFSSYGVTRGAKLLSLGTVDYSYGVRTQEQANYFSEHLYDSPQTFKFLLTDSREVSFTIDLPQTVDFNYIYKSCIFTEEDFAGLEEKVGYLNYSYFSGEFVSTLDEVFSGFKSAGIKKLILDLRYNSGGNSTASERLISYIAPEALAGKPYLSRSHNHYLSSYDETAYLQNLSIGLTDIYFIMSGNSASASEVVYNGLRPYMKEGVNLHMVGKQTYGKPNGMYEILYPGTNEDYEKYQKGDFSALEWAFYPICYYNKNSAGDEIPSGDEKYSGFIPQMTYPDDIYHDFCPEEENIKACLTHITTGSFPEAKSNSAGTKSSSGGISCRTLLSKSETDPHYGRYVSEPRF